MLASSEEVEAAIGMLCRRIEELEKLDVQAAIFNSTPAVDVAQSNVRAPICDAFGPNSLEFKGQAYVRLWDGPRLAGTNNDENLEGTERGRVRVIGI
jgi:hypothetical protein